MSKMRYHISDGFIEFFCCKYSYDCPQLKISLNTENVVYAANNSRYTFLFLLKEIIDCIHCKNPLVAKEKLTNYMAIFKVGGTAALSNYFDSLGFKVNPLWTLDYRLKGITLISNLEADLEAVKSFIIEQIDRKYN